MAGDLKEDFAELAEGKWLGLRILMDCLPPQQRWRKIFARSTSSATILQMGNATGVGGLLR